MTERNPPRIPPDIEVGIAPADAPVVFGRSPADLTPNTLKVIRKNAGKLHATEIAAALCWPMSRLRRVAEKHGIPLNYAVEPEPRGA